MPIYGYDLLKNSWTLKESIALWELKRLVFIFKKAKSRFEYNTDVEFCNTVLINEKMKQPFVASFDYSKTKIPISIYQKEIESLVECANELLKTEKDLAKGFDNIKFDIMGSWTIGHVILMEKINIKRVV